MGPPIFRLCMDVLTIASLLPVVVSLVRSRNWLGRLFAFKLSASIILGLGLIVTVLRTVGLINYGQDFDTTLRMIVTVIDAVASLTLSVVYFYGRRNGSAG